MGIVSSGQTLVNTYTTDSQTNSQITLLADGGWVVTWQSNGQDGDSNGIYQQAYNADGTARGDETQVNSTTTGDQTVPDIAALASGGWVVTWLFTDGQNPTSIKQQAYSADGNLLDSETSVSPDPSEAYAYQTVAALDDGGWVVAWSKSQGVWQQTFNADGSARSVGTLVAGGYSFYPTSVQIDTIDGGWVVSWMSNTRDTVVVQAYAADGTTLGSQTSFPTYATSSSPEQDVAVLAGGGWVMTWTSEGEDGDGQGVYQQAFNADGSTNGAKTLVNSYTASDQLAGQVTALTGGGWVVTWMSVGQGGSSTGVYQQAYDSDGNAQGVETKVNAETSGQSPYIAALADGSWVVVWTGSDNYLRQQAYNADGSTHGAESTTHLSGNSHNTVTALPDGGWVVMQYTVSATGEDVIQEVFHFGNNAPTLDSPIADQTANEDSALSYQLSSYTFSDLDQDALIYTATRADGSALPSWLHFDAATQTFSGTPLNDDVGTISVKVIASDGTASVSDTFDFVIANTNDAPTVTNAISNQVATEDAGFQFTFAANTFTDVDVGDTLTYTATLANGSALPSWMHFDAATRTFSGTPLNDDVGAISIKVVASDGSTTVSNTFGLTIANTNDAPTVANPIADQAATQGSFFWYNTDGVFADVDLGTTLTYSATLANGDPLPAWLSIDPTTGYMEGTPDNDAVGTISVKVTASDGTASASDTFALTVANINDAPTLDHQTADQTTDEDASFTLSTAGAFGDVDVGDTRTYSATLFNGFDSLPSWLHFDSATGVFSGTPDNDQVGTINVLVKMTDSAGEAASETFNITVANTNDAPVVHTALPDLTTTEDGRFNVSFASDSFADVDTGTVLTYTATLANGDPLPTWLHFSDTDLAFNGTPDNDAVGTLHIKVTASDVIASVSDTFDLTVDNTEDQPTVEYSIDNQTATQDSPFNLNIADAFADVDVGDTLTYTALLDGAYLLPAWLTLDPATGAFSGTPANADVGHVSVTVIATDTAGLSATQSFTITVGNINDAPNVAHAISDQTVAQDSFFSLNAIDTFSDMDGDSLSYTATLANGDPLPSWLTYDGGLSFSGTPGNDQVGTLSIKVTASDGTLSVSDTFNIVVSNVNDAPTLTAQTPTTSATEDSAFSLNIAGAFTDIDVGDTRVYSATNWVGGSLPSWLHFDQQTGTFSGTPDNDDVGPTLVLVTLTDSGGKTASETFQIVVANTNDAPVLDQAIPNQTVDEDGYFQFATNGFFSDVDVSDSLTYTATLANGDPLPSWLSINSSDGALSGTPDNDAVGTISVKITASDGTANASGTFQIAVDNTEDAPTRDHTVGPQTTAQGADFSLSIASNFSDVDVGDTLTYSAALENGLELPSWLHFDTATGAFSGTPGNDDVDTLSISVVVRDASGQTATDTFSLAIDNTNDAPTVVSPIENQTVSQEDYFYLFLDDDMFADIDPGTTLTYSATLANGDALPSWLHFNAQAREFSGTPENGDVGTISVKVIASDGVASVSDTFEIDVANINDSPVATGVIDTQAGFEDKHFSFTFAASTFTDIDVGDTLTYEAQLDSGDALPSWLVFDSTTRTFSGTPANGDVGAISVLVTAIDGDGQAASTTFEIDIANTNDAPTGANKAVTIKEDHSYTFKAANFGFADADGEKNHLAGIVVTALPGSGKLLLDGVKVTKGEVIEKADLAHLVWTPAKDANGEHLATMKFKVMDDGGTANGGHNLATSANTFTFNVTAVTDVFTGTKAANVFKGTADHDVFNGKGGNDKLTGLGGSDTFIFGKNYDRDTITDFTAKGKAHDIVDLSHLSSVDDFKDLKAHHMSDHGHDVWIDGGSGDVLVIKGVEISELGKADFLF